jgi:hypothetical protein
MRVLCLSGHLQWLHTVTSLCHAFPTVCNATTWHCLDTSNPCWMQKTLAVWPAWRPQTVGGLWFNAFVLGYYWDRTNICLMLAYRMFLTILYFKCEGRDSLVGIATRYGLDGPGIECRWGRDFPHTSRPALGPNPPPIQWVAVLFRG